MTGNDKAFQRCRASENEQGTGAYLVMPRYHSGSPAHFRLTTNLILALRAHSVRWSVFDAKWSDLTCGQLLAIFTTVNLCSVSIFPIRTSGTRPFGIALTLSSRPGLSGHHSEHLLMGTYFEVQFSESFGVTYHEVANIPTLVQAG